MEIRSLKLHNGQKDLLKHIQENNECMYHTIVCSRQFGKSVFMIQLMLNYSINNGNTNTMFISPTFPQSKRVYKLLMKGIRNSDIIESEDKEENSITLVNGSVIYYKSGQLYENLRGYDIDYLYIDEFRDIKDEAWYGAFRPMLTVRGKKCFLISTPKGKNNALYKSYMLGLDENEPRYSSFRATYRSNPYANIDEINDAKKCLPERLYLQEYEAEFVDGGGDVFKNINKCAVLNNYEPYTPNKNYFAGIDIGKSDYTVCTIMDNFGNVVYIYRDHNKDYSIMIDEIAKVLNTYKPKTLVETNGVGNVFFDMLKKKYKIEAWVTSNKSKQMIIEELIVDFENEDIKIPNEELLPALKRELEDFSFNYSPATRQITYAARTGNDDTVMSTAICNHCRRIKKNSANYKFG